MSINTVALTMSTTADPADSTDTANDSIYEREAPQRLSRAVTQCPSTLAGLANEMMGAVVQQCLETPRLKKADLAQPLLQSKIICLPSFCNSLGATEPPWCAR